MREEIKKFAEVMERRLQENDHKTGWKDSTGPELLLRLFEEGGELLKAKGQEEILKECADVANFAMMIADNFGGLKETP